MPQVRIAYMPLVTYPEPVEDESILATTAFASALKCMLHVTAFSVHIPQLNSPLGQFLIDVPGLVRASEERSKAECHRLQGLIEEASRPHLGVHCTSREIVLGGALNSAAAEARYFDLTLLPWSDEIVGSKDIAEAVVFGSGRPAILIPAIPSPASFDHLAIAWDASRVAARALGDALPLLVDGGRISVLTVKDEKPLSGPNIAAALASSLEKRGFRAKSIDIALGDRAIGEVLQETALSEGAQILAMGGFGHSRIRDFILGGATKGVLNDLRLPVLFSH
ncbi:nucleotide-binding universal stress UspA family protein [Rhodoligotrophos appendicifer]|uniref:universal stress protein n=1 Tax=Rhodoligotrophos appendicifer TaxID=987056 RepID=UPI0011848596|nr:universal stress protein [Rhodoligotrophos appendicifer]